MCGSAHGGQRSRYSLIFEVEIGLGPVIAGMTLAHMPSLPRALVQKLFTMLCLPRVCAVLGFLYSQVQWMDFWNWWRPRFGRSGRPRDFGAVGERAFQRFELAGSAVVFVARGGGGSTFPG